MFPTSDRSKCDSVGSIRQGARVSGVYTPQGGTVVGDTLHCHLDTDTGNTRQMALWTCPG